MVELDASFGHSIVRFHDGSLLGWGANYRGQITPVQFPPGTFALELAAGSEFSLARLNGGTLFGGGDNNYHQLDFPPLPCPSPPASRATSGWSSATRSPSSWTADAS